MKQRIISGGILVILVVLVLFLNIPLLDTILVFLLSAVGIYEYNKAFKSAGYKPVPLIGYVGCLGIFLIGNGITSDNVILIAKVAVPALLMITFIYCIIKKLKVTVIDVAITILSLIYIPLLFSFVKFILMMQNGRLLIWYVLLGAFACDTCAYFIGCKFGKRKLCPDVSPKKTVEGFIAGILGVVISYIIVTCIGNIYFDLNINVWLMMGFGVVVAIIGQFGDLSASAIKRFCKIKDFGSIMPGHGGILDRCDSILFVAPLVYILLKVYIFM